MKTKIFLLLLLTIGITCLSNGIQAQVTTSTAGGDATGDGGTVSYTIGQVFYQSIKGTNGNTVSQGVQQPFEISVETGIPEASGINIGASAYPNPTTDHLTVKVEDYDTSGLQFMLFDMSGKLIKITKAEGIKTQIDMSGLIPASYFIKVLDKNKEIKVFKIIKH